MEPCDRTHRATRLRSAASVYSTIIAAKYVRTLYARCVDKNVFFLTNLCNFTVWSVCCCVLYVPRTVRATNGRRGCLKRAVAGVCEAC